MHKKLKLDIFYHDIHFAMAEAYFVDLYEIDSIKLILNSVTMQFLTKTAVGIVFFTIISFIIILFTFSDCTFIFHLLHSSHSALLCFLFIH